jgi:hypothetical protein
MLFLCISIVGAEDEVTEALPIVVDTKIEIVEYSGVERLHIAERSKGSFQYLRLDWWDVLPIMRQLEDFPVLDEKTLSIEADNLLNWYIDHGWIDAVVGYTWTPYNSKPLFRGPRRTTPMVAQFTVHLGTDWTLTSIELSGLHQEEEAISVIGNRAVPISWDRQVQKDIEMELRSQLGNLGYANPLIYWQSKVKGQTEIGLEGHVEWGQRYRFGQIQILDEDGEPWDLIRIDWHGSTYDLEKIERMHHRIQELPSVASVDMDTVLDEPNGRVDVVYRATRNRKGSIEGLGGFTTQATIWAFDGGFGWRLVNHTLPSVSISGAHTLGYRAFPKAFDFSHKGWATNNSLESTWSVYPRSGLQLFAGGNWLMDLQMGFQESVLSGEVGLRWQPSPFWTIDWTQEWTGHQYSSVQTQDALFQKWFYEYGLLTYVKDVDVSMEATWHRPDISFVQLTVVPWGELNGQLYQRAHMAAEVRTSTDRWLWRNRAQGGVLRWENDSVNTLHNRFFLGGGQSLRGWSYNKVHPPKYSGQLFDVNVGGDKSIFLSTEVQYRLVSEFRLLTFFDVGRVWERWDDPMPLYEWQPSTGIGVIIPTMVGDVALTEAVALHRNSELIRSPNRFVFHCILVREMGE